MGSSSTFVRKMPYVVDSEDRIRHYPAPDKDRGRSNDRGRLSSLPTRRAQRSSSLQPLPSSAFRAEHKRRATTSKYKATKEGAVTTVAAADEIQADKHELTANEKLERAEAELDAVQEELRECREEERESRPRMRSKDSAACSKILERSLESADGCAGSSTSNKKNVTTRDGESTVNSVRDLMQRRSSVGNDVCYSGLPEAAETNSSPDEDKDDQLEPALQGAGELLNDFDFEHFLLNLGLDDDSMAH